MVEGTNASLHASCNPKLNFVRHPQTFSVLLCLATRHGVHPHRIIAEQPVSGVLHLSELLLDWHLQHHPHLTAQSSAHHTASQSEQLGDAPDPTARNCP
jgi:hypothetical protein